MILSLILYIFTCFFYIFTCRCNRLCKKTLFFKYKVTFDSKTNPILFESATEMAKMIKNKKITVQNLIQAHIDRIKDVNETINVVVQDRFKDALEEAKNCDKILSSTEDTSKLPFLFGVPMTVKESYQVKGMSNTAGIYSRKNIRSEQNAPAVQRLVDAGAIILCVTNTSEACLWIESSNYVTGRSNNPFDSRHTCGGSSGGEAAIISSCGSPFGLGGDIGGSIRIPAFFCGVFGHKPSPGLVPNGGHYPTVKNEQDFYMSTGPICRKAKDLYPLLKILSVKDIKDPSSVDLSKLRVFTHEKIDRIYLRDVCKEVLESQRSVVRYFENIGSKICYKTDLDFNWSFEMWSSLMKSANSPTFYEHLNKPFVFLEIIKWFFNLSNYTIPALIMCYAENLPDLLPSLQKKFIKECEELKKQCEDLLGDDGVLIFPSYSVLAPQHYHAKFLPIRFAYAAIFNVLGLPVTQVPVGVSKSGLPMGVQVVANRGNDHITIAVANALEKEFGGWKLDKI